MSDKKREKKLLLVAALMFAGYFLPFYIAPVVIDYVKKEWSHYQDLQLEIKRYTQLHGQTQIWRDRHVEVVAVQEQIRTGVLEGSTRDLVAGRVQNQLKRLAKEAGVQVKSQDVPEFATTGEWLQVTQAMHFQANSSQTLQLLQGIENSDIFLPIVELDVRIFRSNLLNGMVKVTGFSAVAINADE